MNKRPAARRPNRKQADRYHHGDLRNALCDAAWAVLVRDGVEALSLRALAVSLGVSYGAPAHHFADKEALLDELRLVAWTRFADALEAGAGTPPDLRRMGLAYVEFALAHRHPLQLMFRPSVQGPTQAIRMASRRAWETLVQSVATHVGLAAGGKAQKLERLAMGTWAQVHGLAMLWSDVTLPPGVPGPAEASAWWQEAIEVLAQGLSSQTRSRRHAAASRPGG